LDVYHHRPSHRSNHAAQGRLGDSNRNLGVRALLLLGALGRAMGPAVERAARQCLAPALACLADKKKPVRGPCDWGRHGCLCAKLLPAAPSEQPLRFIQHVYQSTPTIQRSADWQDGVPPSKGPASWVTCPQVRDAVITMLDDWVGERGRVPLERLAPAVHDVTVAPKMSPEGRTAAIAWLGGALAAEQVHAHAHCAGQLTWTSATTSLSLQQCAP
jgi:hypothetical protein